MDNQDRQLILDAEVAVFDFDGTLARLDLDWAQLKADLSDFADCHGYPDRFETSFHPDLACLRRVEGEDFFLEICEMIGRREADGFSPLSVDRSMVDVMIERREADKPNVVFTANTRWSMERIFDNDVWRGLRPTIVGKEDVTEGKPDPEGLQFICDQFSVAPGALVFVGDSDDDEKAAAAAGAAMVRVDSIAVETPTD